MPPSRCSAGSGPGGSRWSSSSTTSAPSGSCAIAWWSSIPGGRSRRGRPRRRSPRPRWSRSTSGARDRAPLRGDRENPVTIFAQNALFGLLIGGLYGLAAVGLSLVFGVLKMLNVAHGELIMLGGYVGFWLFAIWGIDPFLSLAPSALALFLAGGLLYRLLFSRLLSVPEETKLKNSILIGFGLALVLQTLAIRAWTADERVISTSYAGAVLPIDGAV